MDLKDKLKQLPKKPGCYQMFNQDREIIYVGKAKNLFNRVRSYFVGSHDAKTTRLIANIADFEYIVTSTETEAFILEINLIKKHKPKYNISLTDDRQYPYILITDEKDPKITYTREMHRRGKFYGPYPNATAAKEVVDLLNRIYPLRKCSQLPKKECLYYHLGQCLAPCIKEVKPEQYQDIISKIQSLLKGNVKEQQKQLEKQMNEASENLDFEKAIEYRQLIADFNTITEKQKMELDVADTDVFAYVVRDSYLSIQVFHIRGHKTIARNGFLFEVMGNPEEMFVDFIAQFYLERNFPLPKEVLIPSVDYSSLAELIKNRIVVPKKGQKRQYVMLVKENAMERLDVLIAQEQKQYEKTLGAVVELGKLLAIPLPKRIEAFDNSHNQGMQSVSAMVVYEDGLPKKQQYRKYKIKTVVGANDYQSMYEVISRRYRPREGSTVFPNLIIVDGGKPQVSSALKALADLKLSIPVLGLGKDDKHRTAYLFFNNQEIYLDKKSPLFFFLENLQDEVHRYAITFHHLLASKTTLASQLDDIKGIGKVRKRQIIDVIKRANQDSIREELQQLKLSEEQMEAVIAILNR
ncbi:MAG TPA: excinuclease ABC subunit UvrC [Bacilli bacterium]|nr:MAG: UvrABC system protein C [Tenericutes bacterium ADurb.BinA124]HNZ50022.1 excinuclease ABC subunit UvrC [Bacilli bacterium]HOH17740.1 excinuclease ABC subunit UvrC [Bacilli bacterium]HPN60513.1 excinuclease ABC subunit UvrC [Bacilli bacterium]HPX84382.1 excinuclease ABC subunit UvrC [Bacilli bacterium]